MPWQRRKWQKRRQVKNYDQEGWQEGNEARRRNGRTSITGRWHFNWEERSHQRINVRSNKGQRRKRSKARQEEEQAADITDRAVQMMERVWSNEGQNRIHTKVKRLKEARGRARERDRSRNKHKTPTRHTARGVSVRRTVNLHPAGVWVLVVGIFLLQGGSELPQSATLNLREGRSQWGVFFTIRERENDKYSCYRYG